MVFFLLTGDNKNGIIRFEIVAAAKRGQCGDLHLQAINVLRADLRRWASAV
jgi:hypothetical protein